MKHVIHLGRRLMKRHRRPLVCGGAEKVKSDEDAPDTEDDRSENDDGENHAFRPSSI